MQQTLDGLAADERTLHLASALALADAPEARVVWVVDQLEEAFTLARDDAERRSFLANLAYAGSIPGGQTMVVATMRADFYPRLAEHADVAQLALDEPVPRRSARRRRAAPGNRGAGAAGRAGARGRPRRHHPRGGRAPAGRAAVARTRPARAMAAAARDDADARGLPGGGRGLRRPRAAGGRRLCVADRRAARAWRGGRSCG